MAIRQARLRKVVHDAICVDNVKLLSAMGALDSVVEQVEAHTMTTDDESDILGIDHWVDTEIEITLDSGCCEHVMDWGDAPGYGAFVVDLAPPELCRREWTENPERRPAGR